MRARRKCVFAAILSLFAISFAYVFAQSPEKLSPAGDAATVDAEHSTIGIDRQPTGRFVRTTHPDAQWFPEAGFGLFIHWGISSVRSMNMSWPMIPGRPLANRTLNEAQRERVIREMDYNLNGRKPEITPNEYWSMAKDFDPQSYDPEKWLVAAKKAGFTYAVLTAKHHEGFALWPSKYGDFGTATYLEGRDLVRPFVDACRKHGLKIGIYFSGPDWHFDRDHFSFLYYRARQANPKVPPIGPDLKPRKVTHTEAETKKHQAEYAALVKGQVEELLTNYGPIDLIWFDGKPSIPNGDKAITIQRIRELQPHIVVNPRMHGRGDFVTHERRLTTDKVANGWAEFCNPWTSSWSHQEIPFRANGFILGQLAECRALGINYLLGVGPMASGEFCDEIYENMEVVAGWMNTNGESVRKTRPLPAAEMANVPATAAGNNRYLFAIPRHRGDNPRDSSMRPHRDRSLSLSGVARPQSVVLLSDGQPLKFDHDERELTVELPASRRTDLVDVVRVVLPAE